MPAARCTPPVVERLREVLGSHPGHHRGAAQAGQRQPGDGAAARPGAAGPPEHGADGRHQGAARTDQRGAALSAGTARRPGEHGVGGPTAAGRCSLAARAPRRRRCDRGPPASAYWRGWPEVRADLRGLGALVARPRAGRPAGRPGCGGCWRPRADFRITDDRARARSASPSAGAAGRRRRRLRAGPRRRRPARRRGRLVAAPAPRGRDRGGARRGRARWPALVAWQVGELLGDGPDRRRELDGRRRPVTTPLTLGSTAGAGRRAVRGGARLRASAH